MFHEQIKEVTTEAHKNAEKHSYGMEIMSRTLTKNQYAQLLIANYTYIAAWEKQWENIGFEIPSGLKLEQRRKYSLLVQDLENLGLNVSDIELKNINKPANYAEFIGRMYVVEGSTLGGAVIEKQLKLNANLEGCSFHFYGGYGQNLIPFWKEFIGYLNEISDDGKDAAIAEAKQTFAHMEQCFIDAKQVAVS
ncbi:MAG: biliverdin-producing heme oxygenase [Flavobacteriales bacterium]|nr:biliverdin-producing heme oxygenase [Flavobacteriales bacterium]